MVPKTSNRVKIHARVRPETEQLGRKLAHQYFQDKSKLGLVIDEAINLFHASKTRPAELESLLSSTEEYLIHNFNLHMKKATDRMASMTARSTYDTAFSVQMLDALCAHVFGERWLAKRATLRKEAAHHTRKKFEKEGAEDAGSQVEDVQRLEEELEAMKKEKAEMQSRMEKATELLKKAKVLEERNQTLAQDRDRLREQLREAENERDAWARWVTGLETHAKSKNRGLLGKKTIIEEYAEVTPKPSRRS